MTYKIFSISDSLLISTGYANQTRHIMKRLAQDRRFEVTHLGLQYIGNPMWYNADGNMLYSKPQSGCIQLVPNQGGHPFAGNLWEPLIKMFQPDITFSLLDSFMLYDWVLKVDFNPSKFIFYFPSDGESTLPSRCETVLKKANVPVAMSKFAQEQVRREYGMDVEYIPHGIPTDFYYPISDDQKPQLKRKWSARLGMDISDKFVILFVGRNQGRKALPELLKVVSKFYKMHKDIVLLLHADPEDQAGLQPTFSLYDLLKRLGIEGITRFTGMKFWWGFPEEDLREIYQISDVHASSTTGEGWGITTTESMSCGIPNILTDFTTTKEILEDGKFGIPIPVKMTITGTWAVERAFIDIDRFVEALETLYKDENLRKSIGKLAREKCVREYDWDRTVFPMWNKLLERELNV